MIISQKLTFEPYLKLNYKISYKKFSVIFSHIFGFFLLLIAAADLFWKDVINGFPIYQLILGVILNLIMPISIFIISKITFRNHEILHGNIDYEFIDETLKVSGTTFKSELNLTTAFKIDELKDWFVISLTKNSSLIIFKETLSTAQIISLREFFGKLTGVKTNLIQS